MTAKLLELLKKYWPYALVLLVGIGVGWGVKPDVVKIEEREKIVEKQVTTEAQKELMTAFENLRIEMEKVRETQVTEKYHREELETRLADGTYTKKVTVDKNIDSHTKETETKVEVKVVEVEKKVETIRTEYVDKIVEKEKIVTPMLAQWHVGVFGGLTPQFVPSVGVQNWVIGGEVERRIVGPVFLGLWGAGTTTGQGMGGLKVGFEF
jgi:hypothetical protein